MARHSRLLPAHRREPFLAFILAGQRNLLLGVLWVAFADLMPIIATKVCDHLTNMISSEHISNLGGSNMKITVIGMILVGALGITTVHHAPLTLAHAQRAMREADASEHSQAVTFAACQRLSPRRIRCYQTEHGAHLTLGGGLPNYADISQWVTARLHKRQVIITYSLYAGNFPER